MGMFLSKPNAYDEPVKTIYASHGAGSVFLALFSMLSVLVLPFIFGILMGGFWVKHGFFIDQPQADFEGKALMRLQTNTGKEYLWASSEGLQHQLAGDVRFTKPFISVYNEDRDRDGHPEYMHWTIEVPLGSEDEEVTVFEFLPAIKYRFWEHTLRVDDEVFLMMEGAPFIQLTAPNGAASSVALDGRLTFDQTSPLHSSNYVRYDRIYNVSHFPNISGVHDLRNIGKLAMKYSKRNESLVFDQRVVSWNPSGDHLMGSAYDSFTCTIRMRIDTVEVSHIPSTAHTVKMAWIQYFCIAYVVYWLFYHFRRIIVKNGLVDTIVLFDPILRR